MHSMFYRYWRNVPKFATTRTSLRFASSSLIIRHPPSNAPREVPTPLVFVSSQSWDKESTTGTTFLSSMLAEKGFTCIENDLCLPDESKSDSSLMMKYFESGTYTFYALSYFVETNLPKELVSTIRLSTIPFPPVVFARASACLIAQTYISSHPASGLVLISPPASNEVLDTDKLPTPLEEFNYEPKFPIAVIATPRHAQRLRESNRICQSGNVDIITVQDLHHGQVFVEVENWLDKLGI